MSKDKISDYSATANSNTDIGGINIDEGCAPSGINDAIRTLMKQLKDWQSGSQDVYIHPAGSASVPSITATGDTNTGLFFPAADTVGITTGGTERARIDSSGNLGLGVTPSAWSAVKAMQIGTAAVYAPTSSQNTTLSANNYYDGSVFKYMTSDYASYYQQFSGQHRWYNAASGTAGNSISFTQAMTLDASGQLGIGTTTPGTTLNIGSPGHGLGFAYVNGSTLSLLAGAYTSSATWGQTTYGSLLLKARTDYGGYYSIDFITASSDNTPVTRARIDSNGTFKNVATLNYGLSSAVTAAAGTSTAVFIARYSATAGDTGSGTNSFIVWSNGNVVNTNNSYGAISDIKLKENITDTTPKLADLMQVRVRNYNLKNAPEQKQLGVIAQELEQVFPSMVDESPDRDVEGNDLGTTTKQVKYSVFVPMLIKAIQEQQAIIETLTNRITALEQA